jgi:hypothetical protein
MRHVSRASKAEKLGASKCFSSLPPQMPIPVLLHLYFAPPISLQCLGRIGFDEWLRRSQARA